MPLFNIVVLKIDTAKLTSFEVIQLSSQADDIMSLAMVEVIKPPQQVGIMFHANSLTAGV